MSKLDDVTIEIQEDWFSAKQCQENPTKLYVFGDNTKRFGKGGQAIIRDEPNTFGLATKRYPGLNENDFFLDTQDDALSIMEDIIGLINIADKYETIVLPKDGLGTGLSKMPENSPKLFRWLHETLSFLLDVDYRPWKLMK